ncbi:IgGFc-binding protein-like [Glandiceps talaboti]
MTRLSLLVLAMLSVVVKGQENCRGICRALDSSGSYCGAHEFEDHDAECDDNTQKCCVDDCGDIASPCKASCYEGGCPSGKIEFTVGSCMCHHDPGMTATTCCRDECSQEGPCIDVMKGYCTYEKCGKDEKTRLDICLTADSHCCVPKGQGRGGGGGNNKHLVGSESGDPRVITGDGFKYYLSGLCTYTLIRACENVHEEAWFTVMSEHVIGGDPGRSYIKGIVFEIDKGGKQITGERHKIEFEKFGKVQIDDVEENVPEMTDRIVSQDLNLIVEVKNGKLAHVKMGDEFDFSVNLREGFRVESLGANLQVCGLLGDFDNNNDNDIQKWDQTEGLVVIENPTEENMADFISSWAKSDSCE